MSKRSTYEAPETSVGIGSFSETIFPDNFSIEHSRILIVHKDAEGRYVRVNRAWELATGLTNETVCGKTDLDLFGKEAARSLRDHDLAAAASSGALEQEDILETPKGTRTVISRRMPWKGDKDKPSGITVVMVDITDLRQTQKELKACEERYRILFDKTQVALFRRHVDGRLLEINPKYAEMAGYASIEECVSDLNTVDAWVDPKARDEYYTTLKEKGFVTDYETKVYRRDGKPMWVLASSALLPDGETVIGSIVGIDERKQAELALEKSEALQRKLLANIGDVIVIIDRDGVNRYKSPNIEKMFGWKPEDVVGASTWENVHPEDLPSAQRFFIDLLKRPHAVGTLELRYKCKDGTYRWIEFTGSNFLDDPEINGLLGNYHDIMERKQAEQNLRESEARFKALHNASFGGIAIHDKGLILDCNQGLSEMTGYSQEELIGMDGLLLIAEHARGQVMKNILSGYEKPYESVGLRKDKTEYPLRIEARNIPYKGQWVRSVEFRDLSDVKKAEAERKKLQDQLTQAQKMESVGRLAGGVAHDYNNMLSVILGYTELALMEVPTSAPLHDKLRQIQNAAKRSADITRQLLAFARKQTISPKIVDINATIESTFNMLRHLIGEDIEISWHPGSKLSPVKVDPSQIEQILVNLCVNSRDAIGGVGKIVIETRAVIFEEANRTDLFNDRLGKFVMLGVSDNGCGMSRDTLEHIFEPFFTTKGAAQGTGLGLATVYGIVQQNNGFVKVFSEPGQGTTFQIYLPCHAGSEKEPLSSTKGPETPLAAGETILLVEDEPAIRDMCLLMLEKLGYLVLTANDPQEALQIAGKSGETIDLVLTDVVMPGMNGRELMEHIREIHPDIKTLFMSGYPADVIAIRGVLEEEVQFIQKPFSLKELGPKIREALKK
jgi:PAS domain S-box-containing protein